MGISLLITTMNRKRETEWEGKVHPLPWAPSVHERSKLSWSRWSTSGILDDDLSIFPWPPGQLWGHVTKVCKWEGSQLGTVGQVYLSEGLFSCCDVNHQRLLLLWMLCQNNVKHPKEKEGDFGQQRMQDNFSHPSSTRHRELCTSQTLDSL